MRRAAALLLALVLAPGCGWFSRPSTWEEWLNEAPAAWKAGNYAKVFELCSNAFDAAHLAKQGAKAVLALECMAEASTREEKPEKAFPAYAIVLRDYAADVFRSGSGLRLRNNYGANLVNAGEKQAGLAMLEEALDADEGTIYHSSGNYRLRMFVVANLARAARVFADTPIGIRVSSEILFEIENHLVNERFRQNMHLTLGTADALLAIAELVRLRGDPARAEEIVANAREQRTIEDVLLEGQQRRPQCEPRIIRALSITSCYAEVK